MTIEERGDDIILAGVNHFEKAPVGLNDFGKVRMEGLYYVDKTAMIESLLDQVGEVNLIARPPRFGKSLMMSMLDDFFDVQRSFKHERDYRDERMEFFEGLAITKNEDICSWWKEEWPVVSLSLESVVGKDFHDAMNRLEILMSDLCKKYDFVIHRAADLNSADQEIFQNFMYQEQSYAKLLQGLTFLMHRMRRCVGSGDNPVILLVDAYDVPLESAYRNGYYDEMLDAMRVFLGRALRSNPDLKFAVLSGSLALQMELNNLVADTTQVRYFGETLGFTASEVHSILSEAGFSEHEDAVRAWCGGYCFGGEEVYCPSDVMSYVAALKAGTAVTSYFCTVDADSQSVLEKMLENENFDTHKIEMLLGGECIYEEIQNTLDMRKEASEQSFWSYLLMKGFLTAAKEDTKKDASGEGKTALRIPNENARQLFRDAADQCFQRRVKEADRSGMFEALWSGDLETAESAVSDWLFDAILSPRKAPGCGESTMRGGYCAFLTGILKDAGYAVEGNRVGEAEPDVVVKDRRNRRVMIFEVKHAGEKETMESAAQEAIAQLRDRDYAALYAKEGYRTIVSYGVSFREKDCRIIS